MNYEDYKFPRATTFRCWKCGKPAVGGTSEGPFGEPKTDEWCEEHKPPFCITGPEEEVKE